MITVTYRCKITSIRFNGQQSSTASLFKHYRIEIWKWAAMRSFSSRNSTSFLGVISFYIEHTVSMEFWAIRPKVCVNFQFARYFIDKEIRWKSQHFLLWTHGNQYQFCKDSSTITVLLKRIKGQTRGWRSLIMKVLWLPIYYNIEGNYVNGKK